MKEIRAEAMKKCELVVEHIAKIAEGLQRLSDTAFKARTLLDEGTSALDVPTPCGSMDLREAVARLDRQCARIEILVQLAADAEVS